MRSLPLLALLCCSSPSADEVKDEFDRYVADRADCTTADDCTVVAADCPLGCWVAVRADRTGEVEEKAEELVDDYESGGARCDYECAAAPAVACTASVCTLE